MHLTEPAEEEIIDWLKYPNKINIELLLVKFGVKDADNHSVVTNDFLIMGSHMTVTVKKN